MLQHRTLLTKPACLAWQDRLRSYLAAAIPGFPSGEALHIQQFKHGQSNPTYLLQARHDSLCTARAALPALLSRASHRSSP
jgi:aminoglycoside phosphotransferase (APT) family kinase protein